MRYLILFCILISNQALAGVTPRTVELNNLAAKDLEAQNYQGAEKKLVEALAVDPLAPELHLNLGLAFLGEGQVEKATSSFEFSAKSAQNPQTQFAANFNLGFVAGKQQKIDEALAYYQKALQSSPDSIETKTNIELLIQDQQNQNQKKDKNDKQDKNGKDQSKDSKDGKDDKDGKDQNKDDEKKDESKRTNKGKEQPKRFKSEELTQGDVNKILGEIKQQEQRIRSDYNKKEAKEKPHGKDW